MENYLPEPKPRSYSLKRCLFCLMGVVLMTSCGYPSPHENPVSTPRLHYEVIPTTNPYEQTTYEYPLVDFEGYTLQIEQLMSPNSEEDVWRNTQAIGTILFQACKSLFPSSIRAYKPRILMLNSEEFADRYEESIGVRPSEEQLDLIYAASFHNGNVIIINIDQWQIRGALNEEQYEVVMSQMPALLLEEIFHLQRGSREIEHFYEDPQGSYFFDRVSGFALENTVDHYSFGHIEEAFSLIFSYEVQSRMGINPNILSQVYGVHAHLLYSKMQEAGVSIEEMMELHRTNDLDGLLELLYPQIGGEDPICSRRDQAIREFGSVGFNYR